MILKQLAAGNVLASPFLSILVARCVSSSRATVISYDEYHPLSLHTSAKANLRSAIMSVTSTKPAGKGRTIDPAISGSPSASNDDIIPVLLAANPGLTLNYKQMAALDPQNRSYSTWEHKFRKWRASAKIIADGTAKATGESSKAAGDTEGNTNTEPGNTVKGKPASLLESQGVDDEDDASIKKSKVAKKAPRAKKQAEPKAVTKDDNASDKQGLPVRATTARKGPGKAPAVDEESSANNAENMNDDGEKDTAKANSSKKRDETTQDAIDGSPLKKARAGKKGTARVVKKKAKKPTETEEEISEDEDNDGEAVVKPKPKTRAEKKGPAKVVKKQAKKPTEAKISADGDTNSEGIVKAKEEKAAGTAETATKDEGTIEKPVEKDEGPLVEMTFDEE